MRASDLCETRSGTYRCSLRAGHEGECETVAPSRPWVGPAALPFRRAPRGQDIGAAANMLPIPRPTSSVDGDSRIADPAEPPTPSEAA